ncbi:MAG: Xaa-Pro dipeptidase, partial [Frondihabitans sp.]|nr:Xaa-Pro dipeptidase [Frondihabitans sp.]
GLPPSAVLSAATRHAAAVMGRDDEIGTLAPGLHADLVVVDSDPLVNLEALRAPGSVWKRGVQRFSRETGILHEANRQLDEAVVARWV